MQMHLHVFLKIMKHFFYTWTEARQVCSDSEMCARIGGVAKQMESFEFFLDWSWDGLFLIWPTICQKHCKEHPFQQVMVKT